MTYNHAAIYKAYPNVVTINNDTGAFDASGNQVELDQAKVDAAAIIVDQEQTLASVKRNRITAYTTEADPLFFKVQREEATIEEWKAKIAEIRNRFPYPEE